MTTHRNRPAAVDLARSLLARIGAVYREGSERARIFTSALLLSALVALYWCVIASDLYVSEAHIVIQKAEIASGVSVDIGSILGNNAPGTADQLLLRDYLLSVDMLRELDAKLDLRAHFSSWRRDPLSRMWFRNAPIEDFHAYMRNRVSVDFDGYSGVLVLRAAAFDAPTAHAIASRMVEAGEAHMNALAHGLARVQVEFLEKEVDKLARRRTEARNAVIEFQNRSGMVSPQGTTEALSGIIAQLESRRAELQTRRAAMLGYLVAGSPAVHEVELEIGAIEKEIKAQQGRLAAPEGQALNRSVDEFQRLEAQAQFAEDLYRTALVALEKGRIEATRTLKKVSLLQSPLLPEYPLQPRRIYNSFVFLLVSLLLAAVVYLVAVVIREHRD